MSFSMEIASPEEIQAAIEQEVKPVPEEVVKLKEMADANIATIMTLDIESLANRKEILQSIEAFGMNTMRSSSEKNALLQVSIGKLSKTGDEGGDVAKGLAELHTQLRDLDPSVVDFAKTQSHCQHVPHAEDPGGRNSEAIARNQYFGRYAQAGLLRCHVGSGFH